MGSKKKQSKKEPAPSGEEETRRFEWIPLWGWILVFLVPLALSEYMFYVADRHASMAIFPVVWIGFWSIMMERSGWSIIKRRK